MQRLAVGAGDAHPQHDRADAIGKGGAGILRRPVGDVPGEDGFDVDVRGRGSGGRLLGGILGGERSRNTQREDWQQQRFHADTPWLRRARSAARRLRRSSDAPNTAATRQPNAVPAIWNPS